MSMAAEAVSSSISVIPGLPASVEILGWARARYVFQALEDWLMSEPAKQLPLHEIEREQERRGREIQRLLLDQRHPKLNRRLLSQLAYHHSKNSGGDPNPNCGALALQAVKA